MGGDRDREREREGVIARITHWRGRKGEWERRRSHLGNYFDLSSGHNRGFLSPRYRDVRRISPFASRFPLSRNRSESPLSASQPTPPLQPIFFDFLQFTSLGPSPSPSATSILYVLFSFFYSLFCVQLVAGSVC